MSETVRVYRNFRRFDLREFAVALGIVALLLFAGIQPLYAECALFDQLTDTISVAGNSVFTSAMTYECRLMLVSPVTVQQFIYCEWNGRDEDKDLLLRPTYISAGAHPIKIGAGLRAEIVLSTGIWYHIAYVWDGSYDRIYVNGNRINEEVATGYVGNAPDSLSTVGAPFRDGTAGNSFIGFLDTFRLSTVARYSGASFTPPAGDLASDAYTDLLYNFDEPIGSTTVFDLSGNGRNGTFGVGFTGATSPTIVSAVPEPSGILAFLCSLGVLGGIARRQWLTTLRK